VSAPAGRASGSSSGNGVDDELVGAVPAAGLGTRLSPLPCSKELLPVGFYGEGTESTPRPKTAAHYLFERLAAAGVSRTYISIRKGKWDIPAYFGDGERVGLHLAYTVIGRSYGVPFSVDDMYPFLGGKTVLFGFPDILFEPVDALARLVSSHESSGADVTVGVFPVDRPGSADRIELDDTGTISGWDPDPGPAANYELTWINAVWSAEFTDFMHDFVGREEPRIESEGGLWNGREMSMGDVMWRGVQRGFRVEPVVFDEGGYIDIGNPRDLQRAVRMHSAREVTS